MLLHMISSVAILGQVWVRVNAVLALIAIRTPDSARAVYSFMQVLVFASAAPLSVLSLVSSVVLGLGTKWGVLWFRANLASTGAQLPLLAAATWLSVFKPGGRTRR